jgi:hypothetical protein
MRSLYVDRPVIDAFLTGLDEATPCRARLFLVGETTQVYEGWRPWTTFIEFAADVPVAERVWFDEAVKLVAGPLEVDVRDESPEEVIPLPDGFNERARPVHGTLYQRLELFHFDPYSVSFRYLARGDEPDYHLVMAYLEHGWISLDQVEEHLDRLLPRFSFQTIQQDPAEFRRKYKGFLQMSRTVRAGTTHRPTAV